MNTDRLKEKIRNCGLKCTATRLAVLQYLVKVHRPVSTQEIIQDLKGTAINEVTIYRILESFVEKKVIHPVEHRKRHRLYEAHIEENCQVNHAHFACVQCDKILCLEENMPQITAIPLPPGFQMQQVRLQIEGICPMCNKTASPPPATTI